MLVEGELERRRGRQQALFQQQGDEAGGSPLGVVAGRVAPCTGVELEEAEHLPLGRAEGDRDGLDVAGGEAPLAVGEQGAQVALEPAHHHRRPVPLGRWHALGEAVGVEDLEQGLKGLRVAVVGGGGEEQPVLEVWRQAAHGACAQRVLGVTADGRRGDLVGLVDDEQVEGPGVDVGVGRQKFVEPPHLRLELHPLDRGDETGVGPEGVDAHATLPAQAADVLGVDNLEAQAELIAHLPLPLAAEARRA